MREEAPWHKLRYAALFRRFSRLIALFLSGICIADAFGIHNKHGRFMGATMLFSFCPDQFLQDLINQADAVLIRLGPYVVVVTHSFPVREVMLNPSPCAVLFQQIQQCTNISYRSYVCGRVFFFAFSGSPRMISNCSLVMSLGYDFLFFYFRFSSVTAPVLDN